jgi:hypothetical protein
LSERAMDAMVPAQNVAPNPILLFLGTPPRPDDPSDVWMQKRAQSLAGAAPDTAYIEFSADEDADPDDRDQWAKANPSYPQRTKETAMLRMRANLTEDSFLREGLGIYSSTSSGRVIDEHDWGLTADEASMPTERFAIGVDVAPDRGVSSVAFAGQRPDDLWHVELYEHRNGVGWVVPYVVERCRKNAIRAVVLDAQSPAAALVDEFAKAKIRVTVTNTRDLANACGRYFDAVMERQLRHTDQPQVNLAMSVARKRPLGQAWAWNRKTATSDITPVVAQTLALYGAQAPNRSVKTPTSRRAGRPREALVL